MRKSILFNDGWTFTDCERVSLPVTLPHTWNGVDGQDGGNNYLRTICAYDKAFEKPLMSEGEKCVLQFCGVNSECEVFLNGNKVGSHEGGYSSFCVDLTDGLKQLNELKVVVSNAKNDRVYPQKADFTFYGGIYRDVYLCVLPKNHFEKGEYCSPELKLFATVSHGDGLLKMQTHVCGEGKVVYFVYAKDDLVFQGEKDEIVIDNVHLWNGLADPFLYAVKAQLIVDGEVVDEVQSKCGFRSFNVDADSGFYLNGDTYPLRGVCRHQDRPKIGNAIAREAHEEDINLIMEVGANTVRLAHYQHDQRFYDLCDEKGLIVWAEIPNISKHMPNGNENAYLQMNELIAQNFNHPSIVCWGLSNEITIDKITKDTVLCHEKLHDICHTKDPSRLTVVAGYAPVSHSNPTLHVSDLVSYNLYFGWYFPFFALTGVKLDAFHRKYPDTPIGLSEYGAEAMPNLHSAHPVMGDNTEEYQCIFHEHYLNIINKRPYLWATHVWNMFDFAADARNQGGEPGMNHKGLVTFDRKTKKDAFYLYKAFWSKQEFVHICSKRFVNRTGRRANVKVYSNADVVSLYVDGVLFAEKAADKVFEFSVPISGEHNLRAVTKNCEDVSVIKKVAKADKSYKMHNGGSSASWEK